jgi:hypothetical protein
MTFRHISEALDGVLLGLGIEAGCGCSDERAPTPAHPDTRGTERVTADQSGGTDQPSMRNTGGRDSRCAKETGEKSRSPKAPAKYEDSVAVKEPTRQPPRVLLRIVSSRSECIAMPQRRSPTVAAMHSHLRLVVDNGHHAASARRAAI